MKGKWEDKRRKMRNETKGGKEKGDGRVWNLEVEIERGKNTQK